MIFLSLTLIVCLGLLRPLKGTLIALQYRNKAEQGRLQNENDARHRASLVWPCVFTCAAAAVLVSLGVWQLHRLAWKEGLIPEIETRANGAPQPLPPVAEWPKLRPEDCEYRHVAAEGTFENGKEALVFRASGGAAGKQPGYLVLTPLRLTSGGYVIVNRGFVPFDLMRQPEVTNAVMSATEKRSPATKALLRRRSRSA